MRTGKGSRPCHHLGRDGSAARRSQRAVDRERAARQLRDVLKWALFALVRRIVPRSEPTTAPLGFPNWGRALSSRLVNSWRSPALAFRGKRSTVEYDVVTETRRIRDGGEAAVTGEPTAETAAATTRAASAGRGEVRSYAFRSTVATGCSTGAGAGEPRPS